MEIFIREDGDRYRVFFGPNSIGYFMKDKVHSAEELEKIIRSISYKYCTEWNALSKPKYRYSGQGNKDQGILKDFVDLLW